MRSQRNFLFIGFLLLAMFLVLILTPSFDLFIVESFSNLDNDSFDFIFNLASNYFFVILSLFIVPSIIFYYQGKKKLIVPLWVSFALSLILVVLLKILIMRERPFVLLEMGNLGFFSWDYSFPSAHTAIAFCVLPFIDKYIRHYHFVWIFIAILIALSRLYLAVHFPSDLIAGGLIGYVLGYAILIYCNNERFKI